MRGDAIVADRLSKRYGAVVGLEDFTVKVPEGGLFCLVGPDGAGKTTAIRLLCGILSPSGGSATVLGFDLERDRRKVRRSIGYLSQRFSLYGDLSIDENIEYFAEIHGIRDFRERREELLEFTRLAPFRKRLADRLSGGMKQKLALACTLIHRPRLLFLDEPTTGVDPVSRRDFWTILAELLRGGITIVLSTPYLDEAERASRVALLSGGRILLVDEPGSIAGRIEGSILEITTPASRTAYRTLREDERFGELQLFGDRVHAIVRDAVSAERTVRERLSAAGVEIESVRSIRPRLENAFISLIRGGGNEAV